MNDDKKKRVKKAVEMLANLAVNYDIASKDCNVTGLGELAFLNRVGDTISLIMKLVYEVENAEFMYSIEKDENERYADLIGIDAPDWVTEGEREKIRAFCHELMEQKRREEDEDE